MLQSHRESSLKRSTYFRWSRHIQQNRAYRYSVILQSRQLLHILATKRQREISWAFRQWRYWMQEHERMADVQTMQAMHHDFSDVVNHLNKFRLQLSFTKLFGAMT